MLNVGRHLVNVVTDQYTAANGNRNFHPRPSTHTTVNMFDSKFEYEHLFRYSCDFCNGCSTPMRLILAIAAILEEKWYYRCNLNARLLLVLEGGKAWSCALFAHPRKSRFFSVNMAIIWSYSGRCHSFHLHYTQNQISFRDQLKN